MGMANYYSPKIVPLFYEPAAVKPPLTEKPSD